MIWLACYIATIYAANWTLKTFHIVDIGFGLMAPAGVFWAGLAFTFRDLTHESLGRWWCFVAIAAGALLSYVLADIAKIAIASGVAFAVSETLDDHVNRQGILI